MKAQPPQTRIVVTRNSIGGPSALSTVPRTLSRMMRRSAGLTTLAQDAASAVETAAPARSDHDGRDVSVDPGQAGRAQASNVIAAEQINAAVFDINEIRLIRISQIHAQVCKLSPGINGHIASDQGANCGLAGEADLSPARRHRLEQAAATQLGSVSAQVRRMRTLCSANEQLHVIRAARSGQAGAGSKSNQLII
jgi:hypothetical protein